MAKKFIVNDDSVLNDRGFRVLTSGIRLGRFAKNPLGLFNHIRPDRWDFKKDGILPIGLWSIPQVEGTTLTAEITFDQNDDFAKRIESKVEGGFLRMTSLGLIPITTSSDPRYLLPGQERETLVESELVEITITDIGSNPNTLALYSVDASGNLVELTSDTEAQHIPLIVKPQEEPENKPNMKKIA
ncbi:MAG: hypothetical protein U1C59_05130, partial [Methylotenera sp.]|nr:hypothetical protein [Methylotenera sp.]